MIVVFPLLVIAATVIALRSAERGFGSDGTHWRWFVAWSVAGAAMTFSFLTGLSIGLFVLPLAAVLLLWVARRAPHLADALGFVEGIAVLLLLVDVPEPGRKRRRSDAVARGGSVSLTHSQLPRTCSCAAALLAQAPRRSAFLRSSRGPRAAACA